MTKKVLTWFSAAGVVAACVLPATASANNKPTLRDAGGVVPVGSKFWATNVGTVSVLSTTSNTVATCTTAHMTGTVLANSGGNFEGTISKADFSGTGAVHSHNGLGECTGPLGNMYVTFGLPLCIRSIATMKTHEFVMGSDPGSCGAAGKIKVTLGTTLAGVCEYENTSTVKGDYTTSATTSTLTVRTSAVENGFTMTGGTMFCPSSVTLSAKFELETDTPSGSITDPIWITEG